MCRTDVDRHTGGRGQSSPENDFECTVRELTLTFLFSRGVGGRRRKKYKGSHFNQRVKLSAILAVLSSPDLAQLQELAVSLSISREAKVATLTSQALITGTPTDVDGNAIATRLFFDLDPSFRSQPRVVEGCVWSHLG